MSIVVTPSTDAASVLRDLHAVLAAAPLQMNLVATLLAQRAAHPEPGRYWVVRDGPHARGLVFQSPPTYPAVVTPLPRRSILAAARAVHAERDALPGVRGPVDAATAFAAGWNEETGARVVPVRLMRLYEIRRVRSPRGVGGTLRPATADDAPLLAGWVRGFHADVGEPPAADPIAVVARRSADGSLVVWDDGGPVSTPPERRGRGYAGACVGALSQRMLTAGLRCVLYADLESRTW